MGPLTGGRFTGRMTTTTNPQSRILVLVASGKVVRRVADRQAARPIPIRRGSRSGTPPFDWDRPSTWARHFSEYARDAAATGVWDAAPAVEAR
jgi:uncharacterized protein YbjT (DUF2867 family)